MNTPYRSAMVFMVWLNYYLKVPNHPFFFRPIYIAFLIQQFMSKLVWRYTKYNTSINNNVIVTDIKTLEQMTAEEWREHMKDDPYYKMALVLMAKRKAAEKPTEDQIIFNHLRHKPDLANALIGRKVF